LSKIASGWTKVPIDAEKWTNENWYVSEYNFAETIRANMKLPAKVTVTDATLRDGEQMAGVVFNREDKMRIARKLDEIGIHRIEAGYPAVSKEDEEAVKAIVRERLNAKITALAVGVREHIDKVIDCDTWGIDLAIPSGYTYLKYKLEWTEEKAINSALEMVDYAKDHGLWVCFEPYDTTRAKPDFLARYLGAIRKETHVDMIQVVDTVGCASPSAMRYLVSKVKEVGGNIPVEVHSHNNLGLATANALAAVEAGAEAVYGCMNGIGEGVGNASIEEVALDLLLLYGLDVGLKLDKLVEVSRLVEELSGVRLPQNKPIVGRTAFNHESGLVVTGVLKVPFAAETFCPELVGQTRKIVLGKKSGKDSIFFKLNSLGIRATEDQAAQILQKVKERSVELKRAITNDEFEEIVAMLGLKK
jgi:isopropylmalate/homocitrate/citramalate synthase